MPTIVKTITIIIRSITIIMVKNELAKPRFSLSLFPILPTLSMQLCLPYVQWKF